jgi:UDP-N-acetylglucosamine--N-acetylmuramyl-(pentapeptide) pyrophosphoryl-undecaprenol N-acetylglucosamine transferase
MTASSTPSIAIACGGTGGHLFPGLAVAEQLVDRGCAVTLVISPKEVDQRAVKRATGIEFLTLPSIGLSRGHVLGFLYGMLKSYRLAGKHFKRRRPVAALAMGGFTSVGPILAAKKLGARTFLHESNTIPGRANRWLARVVDAAFVGFPEAAPRLSHPSVHHSGTPVRRQFQWRDAYPCRVAVGLDPTRPVLLVMGGSQGATAINKLVVQALPRLVQCAPELQLLHLAGPNDAPEVEAACRAARVKAVVHSFFDEMELALGAATLAISRAGASSLAELAAMRVPAILIPYPAAVDNHQFHNARAFVRTEAALMLEQKAATPETLARIILELLGSAADRQKLRGALEQWHAPDSAAQIADQILRSASGVAESQNCGHELESCPPPQAAEPGKLSTA